MRTIGVTGGVGAGKSQVLGLMREHFGAELILADEVAHQLMEPGGECYRQVIGRYGRDILLPSGQIDRRALAEIIFHSEKERLAVNAIVHPQVKAEIRRRIAVSGCEVAAVEAALLLEDHYDEFLDEIWYVYAPEEERIRRLMESRGYSRQKAKSIMDSQMGDEEFRRRCHRVIDNSGDLSKTLQQLSTLLEKTS